MSTTRSGPINVLHVDDDPTHTALTGTLLEEADDDLAVETTTSPDDVLPTLADGDVDCVVSDYDMPETDGLSLLETVRERYPDLPFILFTSRGSEAVASEAISAGVTDYLQKTGGTDQYTVLSNRIVNAVERARAQRARRRQVEAIETAREGISILDDGRFIHVNEAYAELYGYDPGDLLGESWELLYPGESVAEVRETILPTVERTGYWHGTTRGRRADGTTIIEDHVLSLTDDDELVCTVRDVTASEERRRRLEWYETLIEALDDPVYALDETGTFTYVNDAFLALVGYDREEVLGATPELIKDDTAVAAAEERLGRLLSDSGTDSHAFEVEIQPAEGDPVVCEDHIGVLPYEGERFEGSVGVLRDVSDRKAREQAPHAERAFVEQCLNGLDDVFYVFAPDGELLRWNDQLNEVTGYSDAQLAEMSPTDLFAPEHREDVAAGVERVLSTGIARLQADYLTADGERVPHEFSGVRLTDPDGTVTGFAGASRDIGDRLAYEQRLERENERLEEFASIVSHDLRNPLQVARTRVEVARDVLAAADIDDRDGDEVDAHLAAVEDAHERMTTLIAELLALARDGEGALALEPVDVATVAESCWEMVATGEATCNVTQTATVEADESRLRQLLANLFANAVDHAGPTVRIEVGILPDGTGFYVADDGPGTPAAERDRVLDSGYTTDADGAGMGLRIVDRVAAVHGWTVRVGEGPGGGARFEFRDVEVVD